jgi:hypothetical protein
MAKEVTGINEPYKAQSGERGEVINGPSWLADHQRECPIDADLLPR